MTASVPMENLGRGLRQNTLVRIIEQFGRDHPDAHLKDLVIDEAGPGRRIVVAGRPLVNFGSDSFLGLDLSADGHSTVTWHQLRNWEQCRTWPDFKVGPCCSPLVPHSSRAAGFRTEVAFALRWSTIIVLLLQLCVRIRTL